jgi:mannose-6-phosphate isomerase-like protein (cupin superfamily)
MRPRNIALISIFVLFFSNTLFSQTGYSRKSLTEIHETVMELSTGTAHCKPVFRSGDKNSIIKGVKRYDYLVVDSGGRTKTVKFNEEQILFVLGGTGILKSGKKEIPFSRNDFIYIPVGTKYGLYNPRENPLSVIVMGYEIEAGDTIKPSPKILMANAGEVPLQVLGAHGPTTKFQLLLGTTQSKRDKLAAACRVNSLFIMDFDTNGTNIPHQHPDEEEIYLVIKGKGEMVAGKTSDGKEVRFPVSQGDTFFFSPGTLIGFYSQTKTGEEHSMILAVRSRFPKLDSIRK